MLSSSKERSSSQVETYSFQDAGSRSDNTLENANFIPEFHEVLPDRADAKPVFFRVGTLDNCKRYLEATSDYFNSIKSHENQSKQARLGATNSQCVMYQGMSLSLLFSGKEKSLTMLRIYLMVIKLA